MTMHMLMQPGMVYQYPLWGVGLLLAGAAALGAILLGLAIRPFLSLEFRRRHNDVAAAIFTVIGMTFAVLLAFVAMVVWEHYNAAKATSYAEAGFVRDVYNVSLGFADPERSLLRDGILGYVETVVRIEWPAQAKGVGVANNSLWLNKLNAIAAGLKPSGAADGNRQTMLLQSLMRAIGCATAEIGGCRHHCSGGGLDRDLDGRRSDGRFRLVTRRSEHRHASGHVGVMAISGALVLIMIIALSNPFRGDFRVSTDPFDQVLAQIQASPTQP